MRRARLLNSESLATSPRHEVDSGLTDAEAAAGAAAAYVSDVAESRPKKGLASAAGPLAAYSNVISFSYQHRISDDETVNLGYQNY